LRSSWVKIGHVKLPRVLLGTSPFIGAGQFGSRAYAYYAAFYNKPEKVAEVVLAAAELGVVGVQPLPYGFLAEAIRMAQAELGRELVVVATIGPSDPLSDLEFFEGLDMRAALLHGALTDEVSGRELEPLLAELRDRGLLAGYVTHKPMNMLERVRAGELPKPDLVLLPFNKLGYLMDAPASRIAEALRELGLLAFGKKVLAAGRLRPREAFEFALGFGVLEGVAVGVVSRAEAEETFKALAEVAPWLVPR